ncbi:MAG: hypothetical protein ABIF08_04225 [Nanoarchaeota archaeon]
MKKICCFLYFLFFALFLSTSVFAQTDEDIYNMLDCCSLTTTCFTEGGVATYNKVCLANAYLVEKLGINCRQIQEATEGDKALEIELFGTRCAVFEAESISCYDGTCLPLGCCHISKYYKNDVSGNSFSMSEEECYDLGTNSEWEVGSCDCETTRVCIGTKIMKTNSDCTLSSRDCTDNAKEDDVVHDNPQCTQWTTLLGLQDAKCECSEASWCISPTEIRWLSTDCSVHITDCYNMNYGPYIYLCFPLSHDKASCKSVVLPHDEQPGTIPSGIEDSAEPATGWGAFPLTDSAIAQISIITITILAILVLYVTRSSKIFAGKGKKRKK